MKKILCLICALGSFALNAQEVPVSSENESTDNFNRWSIELQGGTHVLSRSFASNYTTDNPSLWNAGAGVRYMFTDKFGLMLDGEYFDIKDGDGSLPFKSNYLRTSLQGVINLGTMMGLREGANRFNFLLHGGFGYSRLSTEEPIDRDDVDQTVNLIAGITPQVRLTDWLALKGDVSLMSNIRQNLTWDGTNVTANPNGVRGLMITGSVGFSIYLGGNSNHADWYNRNRENQKIEELENRLAKIENDLVDSDQDGVPDYLDREPNTVSGVAVDSRGIAVDKNRNGMPDEMESALDERYSLKGEAREAAVTAANDAVRKLLHDGYVNVYFQFNSDKPATYSLDAVNYLIKYMKENPSARGEVIGYADEIGEPAYNQALSQRRAQRVVDILVAAGISADRLTITAGGEDPSVDKSSSEARQLVRRVTFKLQ